MEFTKVEPKQNQPAESSLRRSQPFPVDALPSVMRDMVKTIAKAQSISESFVAYPALSHGAAAIGNSYRAVCYADGGCELPTLWTGVLATSGTGKTKMLNKLSAPFESIEKCYKANYKAAMSEYQNEIKAGNTATLPKEKHLLAGDSTMEFIFVMCSGNPHGLLLSESEGRLFFAFDKYRKTKTDEANFCKLYDNDFFKIGRKGSETITGRGSMNVAMLIQPDNFRKVLTENTGMTTSGLLARMNLCYPPVGEYRLAGQVNGDVYSTWNDTISEMIEKRTEGEPAEIYLDDASQRTWDCYMVDCRNLARRTMGWLGGYYDRLHVTAMRIAIQFHCFEGGGKIMNLDTIERGIAIAEYMKSENERVVDMFSGGGETGESTLTPEQREVMKVLTKHQPATERNIKRHCTEIREKWEPGKLENVLTELLKLDMVVRYSEDGKGNRGTTWWKVKNATTDNNDTATNSAEHGK